MKRPEILIPGDRSGRTQDSFEEFYEQAYPRVFKVVYLMAGRREIAEDCTQEAFARGLERWRRLEGQEWATGWVVTTALNLARKEHRRSARTMGILNDARWSRAPEPEVWDIVKQLPLRQQQVVVLRSVLELSTRETAAALRCSEGTVKVHYHRARAALAKALGEE